MKSEAGLMPLEFSFRTKTLFFLFIFFLFITLVSTVCFAQSVIRIDSAGHIQNIGKSFYLYEDKTAKLTIDDVASGRFDSGFKKCEYDVPNFNVTKSAIWAHFRLLNTSKESSCLLIEPPNLPDIRFYRKTGNGKYTEWKTGYAQPLRERPTITNHLFFQIQASTDTADCYLRFATNDRLQINAKAGELGQFIDSIQHEDMLNSFCFGLMWMMIVYNLFLYFTNKEKVYVFYVLYVFFSFQFMSFLTGYFIYYPGFILHFMIKVTTFLPASLGIFSILFTTHFLNTKKYAPRIHKLLLPLAILISCSVLINLLGFQQEGIILIQLLGLILVIVSVLAGIVALKGGYKAAKYYLAGFGFYMLGLTIFILCDFHAVPFNTLSEHALPFGSAIEVVLLSFAIGDKMNVFQKEKDRLVREQHTMLEQKVTERTKEIQWQKEVIEEKNKDIVSSIEYAKRIQRALLASEELLNDNLPDHFVLYQPKDIVSGDFYWAQELHSDTGKRFLLCTADCTGHGVPGAFMSLLNISFLNEVTFERKISAPDKILNEVRAGIIHALNPTGSEKGGKDGMDCILCSFDFINNQLQFSCANNPLWILRGGMIIESQVDKFPVGQQSDINIPFTLQTIDLQKGDVVYSFTDGYADQFGGPAGKKFKYKQLKELILANAHLPLKDQKDCFEKAINAWKGQLEQVDDILLIGIKI